MIFALPQSGSCDNPVNGEKEDCKSDQERHNQEWRLTRCQKKYCNEERCGEQKDCLCRLLEL